MTDNRVALITGASRGIGRGIALRLAADGYAIIINGKTADPAVTETGACAVKREIDAADGTAVVFRADISVAAEREALADFTEREYGCVDLLVNNAGVEPEVMDMLESDEERFDRVFSTNLKGPYFLTQAIARLMLSRKRTHPASTPRIVFITSVQAYMTNPTGAEYCLTKAALHAAMLNYAHRLGPAGIVLFEISPGIIESDMSLVHKKNIDRTIASGGLLTSRWGKPDDVAAVVSSIARGDLDYSTGTTIEVGGGLGLRRL